MTYWQGVLSRLSVPGILLLIVGAALTLWAPKVAGLFSQKGGERAVTPLKVVGMALAVLGALILLDVFPNL